MIKLHERLFLRQFIGDIEEVLEKKEDQVAFYLGIDNHSSGTFRHLQSLKFYKTTNTYTFGIKNTFQRVYNTKIAAENAALSEGWGKNKARFVVNRGKKYIKFSKLYSGKRYIIDLSTVWTGKNDKALIKMLKEGIKKNDFTDINIKMEKPKRVKELKKFKLA